MTNPLLTKAFIAAAALDGFLILKAHTEKIVALATDPTDALLGASGSMGAPASGVVDIVQAGWDEVRCGGDISFGDPLTCDAAGKAVKAVPVAGSVIRTIGIAMSDGEADDIISFQVAPGVIATPAAA